MTERITSPARRRFAQVDVFTSRRFHGNPVAVILDAEGLSSAEMQRIARWTNLSETTFVLPPSVPGADYQVRLFAVNEELPFAGHPTLGTAHAVLEAGMAAATNGKLVMQCAAGLVGVTVDAAGLSFRLPRAHAGAAIDAGRLPDDLGIASIIGEAELIDTGPHWLVVQVEDVAVLAPDATGLRARIEANRASGLTAYAVTGPGEIGVRTFFFTDRMVEDPVCGSGNAAVAVHRQRAGTITEGDTYRARQGQHIGRDGEIRVRIEGGDVHVGGQCVTCVRGELIA
jgi:PhzF family phenazine biosynthesis protein